MKNECKSNLTSGKYALDEDRIKVECNNCLLHACLQHEKEKGKLNLENRKKIIDKMTHNTFSCSCSLCIKIANKVKLNINYG